MGYDLSLPNVAKNVYYPLLQTAPLDRWHVPWQPNEKLQENPLNDISDRVKQAFKPLLDKGYISSKNLEYLVVPRPRLGRFYLYIA
jgi:hypothetical protein